MTSLAGAPWLCDPAVAQVFDAMDAGPGETRFVGGVVRDALAGVQVADIDLATTATPETTLERLGRAGVKSVPTGLEHGTVTAIVDGRPFEITTLRRDVSTDGRHATVAYTSDWRLDASRRDFTINAMSAERSGAVHDYFGGAEDLAAGRVRFVGVAAERVAEDYLRILRFFRFHAWYGAGDPDPAGLAACRDGVDGLAVVSAERVRVELLRLLGAPAPETAIGAMADIGVLSAVLGVEPGRIDDLLALERRSEAPPDPLLRLAGLAPEAELAARLRLSRDEAKAMTAMRPPWTDLGDDDGAWRRAIYRLGPETFRRRTLLAGAASGDDVTAARLAALDEWRPISFPLKGKDLLALGFTAGPDLGDALERLEARWIDGGFRATRADLLGEAATILEQKA